MFQRKGNMRKKINMKKKIVNVFAKTGYNCIACSPHNPIGLNLQFYEEGEYITADWTPEHNFEGYPGILHGGIQALLLDEISAWTVYIKAKTAGVTSKLTVRYRKEVHNPQSKITVRGRMIEINLCFIEAQLLNHLGEVCAEAESTFFLFPVEKAIVEGTYPEDYNSFFEPKER